MGSNPANNPFTTLFYGYFLAVLLAALYVFCCQGRPQAFAKLTFKKFMKTWREGGDSPVSRFLKTAASCHFQVLYITLLMLSSILHLLMVTPIPYPLYHVGHLLLWRSLHDVNKSLRDDCSTSFGRTSSTTGDTIQWNRYKFMQHGIVFSNIKLTTLFRNVRTIIPPCKRSQ